MKVKSTPKKSSPNPIPPAPSASPDIERRRFDDAFRRHAVALVNSGRSVSDVARELGVSAFSLYEWRRKIRRQVDLKAPPPQTVEGLEEENARLREALHRSQLREEILKKSLGIVIENPAPPLPGWKR
jgi:transposase